MSTEVGQPITVVSPRTGEVLNLDAPTEDLGGYLADVRETESMLREAKRLVTCELVSRFDQAAKWTVHAGGLKLSAPSPAPTEEFDAPALRDALLELVDQGLLSVEAVDAAVETVVSYKARKGGINALRKLGGKVAETTAAHCTETVKERYVSVGRA